MGDYCEMWESLGLDLEAHDQLLSAIPPAYQEIYLNQQNRPKGMEYFDFVVMEIHGLRIQELQEHKAKGGKVVGTFCLFVPEEIVLAAGGICIGLCAGADVGTAEAESVLPKNICPLIKSFMGFKLAKICPYFESCDMIVGETTCDGKKKAFEILGDFAKVHVMETPQTKSRMARNLWRSEVEKFKSEIEALTGNKVTEENLGAAMEKTNARRRALQRLAKLRAARPSPISGKDVLLIEQISFYDDPVRFTVKVNELCDELERRVAAGDGVGGGPRVVVSGCPMAIPNWKLHHVLETSGATVIAEEACIGERAYRDLVDASAGDMSGMLDKIADRYLKIDCACFTPNAERTDHIVELAKERGADGVVHYSLQFCDPYTIECYQVEKAVKAAGIPMLKIETDYGQQDVGQLQTRVEAFLERVGENSVV
ncbi:MAG: 2-hydroxyacyl-CoA dehydratase family protein [Chloroflexi bacterium]|nr:2-hydroxyacyl-CoA dehydratase family protein [Chloroflexota bacterium]